MDKTKDNTEAENIDILHTAEEACETSADAELADVIDPEQERDKCAEKPEGELGELLAKIESLQADAQAKAEEALRTRAEMENYRKRVQREKDDLRKYAISSFIEELLPAMDNLDLGLQSAEQHPEAGIVAEGFKMVAQQMMTTFSDNGVKPIESDGKTFDPNFHDCMSQQPSDDVPADQIIKTVRKGYMLGERLLRPATVIVSTGAAPTEEPPSEV